MLPLAITVSEGAPIAGFLITTLLLLSIYLSHFDLFFFFFFFYIHLSHGSLPGTF